MSAGTKLKIPFRGDRSYIHGTDLFSSLHAAFLEHFKTDSLSSIHFKIPKFYAHPLSLEIAPRFASGPVIWTCGSGNLIAEGRLIEAPGESIQERLPFDELDFCRKMKMENGAAVWRVDQGEPIEALVFLTKFLHQRTQQSAATTKFVFTRLELNQSPTDLKGRNLKVATMARLGDGSYTQNLLTVNDRILGHIYFSKIGS